MEAIAPTREELDFCDGEAVSRLVDGTSPEALFHLAACSSPSLSWEQPGETLLKNLEMTLNVLEAARQVAPTATVVLVGSGQVYGEPDSLPVTEDAALRPGNPYAVSKASGEMLGRQYAEAHGLKVVQMRPFNHAGPGQSEDYVISSIARQIAEAEVAGDGECELHTGNPEVARDFTDVRDVVRAYVLAVGMEAGTFNVCSERAASVGELIDIASACARVEVRHVVDRSRLRADDIPLLYGSKQRLSAASGWRPEIPLKQTVTDALDWWRETLTAEKKQRAR